jgi:hypothetical protein
MPGGGQRPEDAEGSVTELPPFLHEPFSAALSQSLLLPAFVALLGVVAAMFLSGFGDGAPRPLPRDMGDGGPDELVAFTAALRSHSHTDRFVAAGGREYGRTHAVPDYFPDDDEYVEYTIDWDEPHPPPSREAVPQEVAPPVPSGPAVEAVAADESDTEPLRAHVEHPLHAPAETWHGGPVETWHSLLDDEAADDPVEVEAPSAPKSAPEPIGFAHNGFHVDREERFQVPPPVVEPSRSGRHARGTDHDAGTYGRHSMRFRD